MTLFSFGDKLTERYFFLHNFPTCSEKHFIGYATEQRQKAGEGRRKKNPSWKHKRASIWSSLKCRGLDVHWQNCLHSHGTCKQIHLTATPDRKVICKIDLANRKAGGSETVCSNTMGKLSKVR